MRLNLQTLITLLLLTAALVLANFLSTRHFERLDLTDKKQYTLSAATKTILASVDDAVTIKAYFSEKFPPAILSVRRDVEDLLSEIKANGHGMVTVEYVDPKDDKDQVAELEKIGVHADPVQILEKDQVQAVNVYKSIVLYHADKKEVIPSLFGVSDLEYNIAVAIKKLMLKDLPTVAFLGFKDGPSTFNELQMAQESLKKLYDVDTAVVTGGKPIPDGVKTLIIVKPKGLTPREAYEIDQFLMRGGKAVILADGIAVDLRQNPPHPEPVTTGLEEMLAAYGLQLDKNLVYDALCETVSVQVRPGIRMAAQYPPLVKVIQNPQWSDKTPSWGLNRNSPIVGRIGNVVLPWVSTVAVSDKSKAGQVTEIARTSPQSWIPSEPIELAPDKIRGPNDKAEMKDHLVALALSGKLRSAWAGKPAPPPEAPPEANAKPEPEKKDEGDTRLILVGDGDFLMRDFMSPGGTQLFLNCVDWLTLDDSLIAIRTKSDTGRPLPRLEDSQKTTFKAINFGLAPVLVTALGVARMLVRRSRQGRIQGATA